MGSVDDPEAVEDCFTASSGHTTVLLLLDPEGQDLQEVACVLQRPVLGPWDLV